MKRGWIAAIAVVLLALLPYAFDVYSQQVGYRLLQVISLALAWNLLAGFCGQVSLGTGAFVGIGAYAMALLAGAQHSALWWLPASGVAAALFAVLLSPALFRLRGLYFTIGTLALAEALRMLMVNLPTFNGASGIILAGAAVPVYALYWSALAIAVLSAATCIYIESTDVSLSLRAVRDDELVARQMGVRSFFVKSATLTVSAFLIGLVGGLQAVKLGAVEPYGAFGMSWTIDTIAAVIIGGMASRGGPLVGAVLYVTLAELLRDAPQLHGAITGAILLLVIRLAPRGLWPLLRARLSPRKLAKAIADA